MNKLKGIALKKAIAGFVLYNVISILMFFLTLVGDSGATNNTLTVLLGAYVGVGVFVVLFGAGAWAFGVICE